MTVFFDDYVDECLMAVNQVATNQVKYYLLLMLNTLKTEKTDKNQEIIEELTQLAEALREFLKPDNAPRARELLNQINQNYQNLAVFSQTHTLSVEIGYALINIGSAILAVITGTLGALTGVFIGFFRALITLSNPFVHLADGFVTGLAFGGAVGFRIPKKLLKDELTRQLRFCMNGLDKCITLVEERVVRPISHYEERIMRNLLRDCFNGNEEAFKAFLLNEQLYQIATVPAQFLSENLEGFLGHHARIIIDLPKQRQPTILEFSSEEPDTVDARPFSQQPEWRRVSGRKLVEMMALHEQLLVTDVCNLGYILTKMKPGDDNDCLSHVNKILLGTNQEAAKCKRFDNSENWVGRNIIGFFIQRLSPFPQEILDPPALNLSSV